MPAVAGAEQLLPYALCTPDDVQILMQGMTSGGTSPQQIVRLINQFTEGVESTLEREFEIKERTEYFDIADIYDTYKPLYGHRHRVRVQAVPIVVDPGDPPVPRIRVWNSSARIYNANTEMPLYGGYDIDLERGIIRRRFGLWFAPGPRALKVTYTGGLVTSGDAYADPPILPDAPPDLRMACAMQVAAWFSRRKALGVKRSTSGAEGSLLVLDSTDMLTQVKTVLQAYRMFRNIA